MLRSLSPEFIETGARVAPLADETLITCARAVRGDQEAFGLRFVARYDFIFRTTCKWCGKASDAEDIAQDVCVKLATILKSFDGRSAFTSWLYRVTLNAVRDMQRARTRRGRNVDRYAEVAPDSTCPTRRIRPPPRNYEDAVRKLPAQQRDAVLLVSEGIDHAEAGVILGYKEATVSGMSMKARRR